MVFKNLDGVLPIVNGNAEDAELLKNVSVATSYEVNRDFGNFAFSQGIESWLRAVFACNQYVDTMAPWALRKSDPERMKAVLATLFLCVRDLAIAIRPIVPNSADTLLDQMGIPAADRDAAALADAGWYIRLAQSGFRLSQPTPVFPRLEMGDGAEEAA